MRSNLNDAFALDQRGEQHGNMGPCPCCFAIFAMIGWQPALATAIEAAVDITPERITVQFDDYVENASAFRAG